MIRMPPRPQRLGLPAEYDLAHHASSHFHSTSLVIVRESPRWFDFDDCGKGDLPLMTRSGALDLSYGFRAPKISL